MFICPHDTQSIWLVFLTFQIIKTIYKINPVRGNFQKRANIVCINEPRKRKLFKKSKYTLCKGIKFRMNTHNS